MTLKRYMQKGWIVDSPYKLLIFSIYRHVMDSEKCRIYETKEKLRFSTGSTGVSIRATRKADGDYTIDDTYNVEVHNWETRAIKDHSNISVFEIIKIFLSLKISPMGLG